LRYVLDCSVAVKWFVPEPDSTLADSVLDRCLAGEIAFIAPESIVAELGHALRKAVLSKEKKLSADDAHRSIEEFLVYPITVVPIKPLAAQAMQLTVRPRSCPSSRLPTRGWAQLLAA
jgi:predicted nucleic acid-binding protein